MCRARSGDRHRPPRAASLGAAQPWGHETPRIRPGPGLSPTTGPRGDGICLWPAPSPVDRPPRTRAPRLPGGLPAVVEAAERAGPLLVVVLHREVALKRPRGTRGRAGGASPCAGTLGLRPTPGHGPLCSRTLLPWPPGDQWGTLCHPRGAAATRDSPSGAEATSLACSGWTPGAARRPPPRSLWTWEARASFAAAAPASCTACPSRPARGRADARVGVGELLGSRPAAPSPPRALASCPGPSRTRPSSGETHRGHVKA